MNNSFCTSKFNRIFALILTVFGITGGITACEARGGGQAAEYGTPIGTFAVVDFATLESQVLAPYCISCHGSFNTAAGIASKVVPGNPGASSLYTEAASGDMPPGGPALSSAALTIISEYIQQLDTSQAAQPAEDERENLQDGTLTAVTYQTLNNDILTPMCIQCHSNFGTEDGLQNVVVPGDPADSSLYKATANGSMPPDGPALTSTQLSEIGSYISGLKPEAGDGR